MTCYEGSIWLFSFVTTLTFATEEVDDGKRDKEKEKAIAYVKAESRQTTLDVSRLEWELEKISASIDDRRRELKTRRPQGQRLVVSEIISKLETRRTELSTRLADLRSGRSYALPRLEPSRMFVDDVGYLTISAKILRIEDDGSALVLAAKPDKQALFHGWPTQGKAIGHAFELKDELVRVIGMTMYGDNLGGAHAVPIIEPFSVDMSLVSKFRRFPQYKVVRPELRP